MILFTALLPSFLPALLLGLFASPQDQRAQDSAPQPESTILRCGRLLAVPGEAVLPDHALILRGGRITESIPWNDDLAQRGRVIDLSAHFVMPGFIDCHTHLGFEMSKTERAKLLSMSEADQALRSTVFARRTVEAGFTTVRDVGSNGDVVFALRDAIAGGLIVGPRIQCSGEAITPTGGHGDDTLGWREGLFAIPGATAGVADGPFECRKAVRAQVRRGADVIKLTATGGVLSATAAGTEQQFFDDELQAIVDTAHSLGRKVAAHAHGARGIRAALEAGVDSIEHGSFLDAQTVELWKQTEAYLVPTILAGVTVAELATQPGYFPPAVAAKARRVGPLIQGAIALAYQSGIPMAFGTDSGVSRHGDNAREFVLMHEAGVPVMDCLISATLHAADLCDLSREIGTLEVGKRADVVGVQGDPLQDIRELLDVDFVMAAGRVVKGE